jgi:hypothetical protein
MARSTPSAATVLKEYLDNKKSAKKDHLSKYFEPAEELQVEVKARIAQIIHEAEMESLRSNRTWTQL